MEHSEVISRLERIRTRCDLVMQDIDRFGVNNDTLRHCRNEVAIKDIAVALTDVIDLMLECMNNKTKG